MPIDYPDLYTMWLECRSLAQRPLKDLETMPLEELTQIFERADRVVRETTYALSRELGLRRLSGAELCLEFLLRQNARALATCDRNRFIRVGFRLLFYSDYQAIIGVLVHELCHTEHLDHGRAFWLLFERCTRRLGLVEEGYDGWSHGLLPDDPTMYTLPMQCTHYPRRKYRVLHNRLCSEGRAEGE